jgi:hypothetical protein
VKRTLVLHADVPPTNGIFLLEVAIGLGAYRLRPESLAWSLVAQTKVKLELVIVLSHEHQLRELTERFQALDGVTEVELLRESLTGR